VPNVYEMLGVKPPAPEGEAGANSPAARLSAPMSGQELLARGIVSSGLGTQTAGAAEDFEAGGGKLSTLTKQSAAPMAGQVAGQVVGRRFGGKPGELVGETVGSVAGEAFNQATGITEPSVTQLGMAAAAPITGRGVAKGIEKAVPAVAKRLPGAAVEIQKEGVTQARAISTPYMPRVPSEKLYEQIERLNPRIDASGMQQAANELLLTEVRVPGSLQGPVKKVAEDLIDLVQQHQGQVPFQELRAIMRRVGQRTGVVQGLEATEVRGAFKTLKGAIADDLDVAASTSGKSAGRAAGLLKRANETYRKEQAVGELTDVIEGAVNKGRSDLLESFNPAKALKEIADNDFLRKSFTPKEIGEIQAALRGLKGLPSLPPPSGEAAVGSGRVLGRLATGATLGATVGGAVAGPVGSGIGSAAGMFAAQRTHELIAHAVSTDTGRRVLMKMVRAKGGMLDDRSLAILAQFGRTQTTTPGASDLGDKAGDGDE
jgi:hypothetical protein